MEEKPSRAHQKRPLSDNDDSNKPSAKRVRFPKGKKVKAVNEKVDVWKESEDGTSAQSESCKAATERAMRRNQITADLFSEENRGMLPDISAAEVHYKDDETFVDDGIKIEPFNLEKEREEGYFDEHGNFVEYVNENEIKDAWLDSAEVDHKLADKSFMLKSNEDDIHDLSSEEIGKMKRRIADVLEPGETVLRALRRLKGTSNSKKEKMSAATKLLFDQLTEDAMKLMENDVYDENQEVFQREAEGYERLAQARGEGTSFNLSQGKSDAGTANGLISNGADLVGALPVHAETGSSNLNASTAEAASSNNDTFDMFAADDENDSVKPMSEDNNFVSGPNSRIGQPSESGDPQNDYIYDESSGYYYSSSLGYYYDPSSGLYCCAASGLWYSYNEATGTYDEVQVAAPNVS